MVTESSKRKVSLGFIRPENLEENTIYIDIGHNYRATAYSNEKFISHFYSRDGNRLTKSEKYAITRDGGVSPWEISYNDFIGDIVESNDVELEDNERLIEDGSKLVEIIKGSGEKLESALKLIQFSKPHEPAMNSDKNP